MRNRLAQFDKSNREYRSAYNTTETELAANASTLRSMEREERLIAGMERLFGEFRRKTRSRRELNCAALSDTDQRYMPVCRTDCDNRLQARFFSGADQDQLWRNIHHARACQQLFVSI